MNEIAATVAVAGALNVASIGELRRAVERARKANKTVRLDLADLTLADRLSMNYLGDLRTENVEFLNCPVYIEKWIGRGARG